jgi:hypothetical protein
MPLLTTSVPNLVQGVSQQPDNLRYPGQAEEQVNAYSSVVDGLTKRPHTNHVKDLFSSPVATDSLVHFVDRDSDKQFAMVFNDGGGSTTSVSIFNVSTGVGIPVSISANASLYMATNNPLKNLRALTVADNTFVVNKDKTVETDTTESGALAKEALVFIKQGAANTNYFVTVDGTRYGGSGGSNADSVSIAGTLNGTLGGITGTLTAVTVTSGGSGYSTNLATISVQFSGGGGSGAAGTPVVVGDAITGVTITNSGSGYTTAPTITFNSPLTGSGATATATINASATSLTTTLKENIIKIKKTDDTDFTISTQDGLSNTGMDAIYKEVDSVTSLPTKCFNGFQIKVRGDVELSQDDYYVKFETKDGEDFGEGAWVETIGFGLKTTLKASTMPMSIYPNSDFTQFYIDSGSYDNATSTWTPWTTRLAGDDETNAVPSIVGKKINDVFFFKNRLGFLTDGTVVFSEADKYFNLFRTTVLSLLDGDPIDVGVAHTKVSTLKHAVPFQEKLMLFAPQSQFVLRGTDLLTPKTVNISPVTQYDVADDITPLALTNYVYFPFSRANFEGVYEFFVDATTDVFEAAEITAQTPKYVPTSLRQLVGTPAESVIVATSSSNLKHLYVYKYFWQNKEKIQSSWSRFEFADDIVGVGFIDSDLYLVTNDGTKTNLERMSMESGAVDTGKDYAILLDRRVASTALSSSYNASTKVTTVTTMPYDPANSVVYTATGERHVLTKTSTSEFTVVGDLSSTDFYVGLEYDMEYTFSTQTLKQPTERGGKATSNFTYQTLRNGAIDYSDTGHFTVEVTPLYRDTYSYAFNPATLGASSLLGSLVVDSGSFRFPIHAKHDEATIKVKSSSALPAKLLAAEFESFVTPRSRRYGS